MDKVFKEGSHDSLPTKRDNGSEIDLNEDFCTMWEEEEESQKIKTSDSIEQEEVLKLTDDAWISFNDENPDSMIDGFDIEEMTFMLESGEPCENDLKQDALSFQDALSSAVKSRASTDGRDDTNVKTDRTDRKRKQILLRKPHSETSNNRSKSPPRKRRAPNKTTVPSLRLSNSSKSFPGPAPTRIPQVIETQQHTNQFDNQYNTLMRNLAVSMRQTEMTRAQVVKIQRDFRCPPRKNTHKVNNCVSAFFSGTRSTITSGLEQSRRQLQAYMAQMRNCNMMF